MFHLSINYMAVLKLSGENCLPKFTIKVSETRKYFIFERSLIRVLEYVYGSEWSELVVVETN